MYIDRSAASNPHIAARLQRTSRNAVARQGHSDRMRRLCKSSCSRSFAAAYDLVDLIGTELFVNDGGIVIKRAAGLDRLRQRLIFDIDCFERVQCLIARFSHHGGDNIAHVMHLGGCQHRTQHLPHRTAVGELKSARPTDSMCSLPRRRQTATPGAHEAARAASGSYAGSEGQSGHRPGRNAAVREVRRALS
jgi:hypothetical protein